MPHASLLFWTASIFPLIVILGLRLHRTNFILDFLALGSEVLCMVAHESAWDMSCIWKFGFSGLPHFLRPQNPHRAKILPSRLHGRIVFIVFAAWGSQPFAVSTLARIFQISIVSMFMSILIFSGVSIKIQIPGFGDWHSPPLQEWGHRGHLLPIMFFILVPGNFSFVISSAISLKQSLSFYVIWHAWCVLQEVP